MGLLSYMIFIQAYFWFVVILQGRLKKYLYNQNMINARFIDSIYKKPMKFHIIQDKNSTMNIEYSDSKCPKSINELKRCLGGWYHIIK